MVDWNFVSTMSWISISFCLFLLIGLPLLGVVVFPIVLGLAIYGTYKHARSIKREVGKVSFAWDEIGVVAVIWFGVTTCFGCVIWLYRFLSLVPI